MGVVFVLPGLLGEGIIKQMGKYFDNTFFKFLFGFLAILAISFLLLFFTQIWGKDNDEKDSTYVEVSSPSVRDN